MSPDSDLSLLAAILDVSLERVKGDLARFADDPVLIEKLRLAFGENFSIEVAGLLAQDWREGNFDAIPAIELLSEEEMGGAIGAFSVENNRIYLSKEFIIRNRENPAIIASILLEEIGHKVDSLMNETDSDGDEGAIFSALVRGRVYRMRCYRG